MSRGLWFVAGAASGIYALAKARRTLSAFTPDGVGARVAAVRAGARVFTDSVVEGMAEREADLCSQLEPAAYASRLRIGAAAALPPVAAASTSPDPSRSDPSGADFTDSEGSRHGHR